jgi:hypothetical protein
MRARRSVDSEYFIRNTTDATGVVLYVRRAEELMPRLKALRSNGIEVVAIHHRMTRTEPMVYSLHHWGREPAQKLAALIYPAIDQTGKTSSARR